MVPHLSADASPFIPAVQSLLPQRSSRARLLLLLILLAPRLFLVRCPQPWWYLQSHRCFPPPWGSQPLYPFPPADPAKTHVVQTLMCTPVAPDDSATFDFGEYHAVMAFMTAHQIDFEPGMFGY